MKWTVSVDDNGEVYVNTPKGSRTFHASLHESGQWHIKREENANCDVEEGIPYTLEQSHESSALRGIYPIGLFIVIPDVSLHKAIDANAEPQPDVWLDRPVYGGVAEFGVMIWKPKEHFFGEQCLVSVAGQDRYWCTRSIQRRAFWCCSEIAAPPIGPV